MYQALYRKWRPGTFDDVVGQRHVTETLKRQIITGHLSHAYLFVGTRGTGKTTCAKILAKAVNCENPVNGNPCNCCPSCVGINNGSILDVDEIDAASNNKVDNIRTLREEAVFTPANVKKRVYIIDEVHMLSASAFNALLKILEEPPEHLIFILATTELNKVPATILSRCQRFTFKRISPGDIAGRLMYVAEQERINLTEDAAGLLARLADGSLRDALSLFDQCASGETVDSECVNSVIGLAGNEKTWELYRAVNAGETGCALAILDELYSEGKDILPVLNGLMALMRDILMIKIAPNEGETLLSGGFDLKELKNAARKVPGQRLLYSIREIESTVAGLALSSSRKTAGEMCIIKLANEKLSDDIQAISSRLAAVEQKLEEGGAVPAAKDRCREEAGDAEAGEEKIPERAPQIPGTAKARKIFQPDREKPDNRAGEAGPQANGKNADEPVEAAAASYVPEKKAEEQAAGSAENMWQSIVEDLKPELSTADYNTFFSGPTRIAGQLCGNNFIITVDNTFTAMLLKDNQKLVGKIKRSAEKAAGHPVKIDIREGKKESGESEDRLDSLKKFPIVKFK